MNGRKRRSRSTRRKRGSEELGIDMISSLPDNVLLHILSFLLTKDVVRTSVLSTRWLYLWASIANIDLDDSSFSNINDKGLHVGSGISCLESVDRFITLHDDSNIERLRLMFSVPVDASRLNSWICDAVKRNVRDLNLKLLVESYPTLPECLFTCQSLVEFKLSVGCALDSPPATRLPNLKILHLSLVTFLDDLSTQQLFSNCPILEELALVKCNWIHVKNVTISIPTLRSLILDDSASGLIFNCRIKISAANLTYLNCSSYMGVEFELGELCSLSEASVDLQYKEKRAAIVAPRAIRFLHGIFNVKFLSISNGTVQFIMHLPGSLDCLATFFNLTHLKVKSSSISLNPANLMKFLEKLPNLEVLDLVDDGNGCFIVGGSNLEQQRVPSCFNSSLKRFSITSFNPECDEMELVEYVWKNATVLECLSISCADDLVIGKVIKVSGHLATLPKGSKACKFVFC